MIMHFQTWDNGKYGRIWPAVGDDYSWKFTEIVNGCARDEDFENSPVIASHFIGYCINNEPSGDGDIYTRFFSRYYQERLEHYRKMCLHDIKLVRNPKELEKRFLAAHIEEERRMFEASQTLFDYYQRIRSNYTLLYFGYMDFLNEKMPRYYVFREYQRPRIFRWREFDKVSVDCRFTDAYLDQVLSLNLGRVFVPYNYGGITTTDADLEQIKSVYGASENPQNLFYIFVNPTDKKSVARAIYDDFRLDMESRVWHNQAEKKLALEHAERWWEGIEAQPDNMGNIDIIRQQLRLCLETITDANKSNHAPFFKMNYEPLEDDTEIGLYDKDGFGYPAHQFYRLGDDDFSAMMDAFNKWVKLYCGQDKTEPKTEAFKPFSDDIGAYLSNWLSSMSDEGMIEEMQFNEFVNAIYSADFSTMIVSATRSRNKKRLFLLISRIKTWFPSEWEEQAALSMEEEVKSIRNFTPSEIRAAHKKWYDDLDNTFPKYNPTQ